MESAPVPIYIPVIVAAIPVILSPLVAWVLGRSGISRQAAAIDYLNKRLDVLERLDKLHTQLTESPIRPILDTEVEHCRRFLLQPVRFITEDTEGEAAAPQSFWGRFFLTRPAVSPRKRVFKGLFYLFFAFGMLMLVATMPLVLSSDESGARWIGYLLGVLLGVLFYFIPAFLFRLAAR